MANQKIKKKILLDFDRGNDYIDVEKQNDEDVG